MKPLSNDRFERTTRWILCTDGIKLHSLHGVRFWISLVRNCPKYTALSNRTPGCGTLAIDLASSRSPSHPVPEPRKWLKLMLKLLVYIFTLGRVVLVSRSNISKICGLKIEEITNN